MRDIKNAFWFLATIAVMMLLVPALSFGQVAISGSESNALGIGVGGAQQQSSSTTATVNQTFEGTKIPAGAYRQPTEIVIQMNPTIPAFFGPFVPGWKVLDDLSTISRLTMKEAESLGGGSKCLLKLKNVVNWESDQVNILPQWDKKTMPEPVGWIFCTASGETTIDIIADAAKIAMKVGATDLVLLKHKVEYSTSGWGVGLGFGLNASTMGGDQLEKGLTGGGVTGTGFGKTKGNSDDGIVFGILRR